MPTPTKYKSRTTAYVPRDTYRSSRLYANSSTAYDIPAEYPVRKPAVRRKPAAAEKRAGAKASARTRHRMVRVVLMAAAVMLLSFTVIYNQTVILDCNQRIKDLQKELSVITLSNQELSSKIEISIERSGIEKQAKEQLGMMKPETYQIFYIDMHLDDSGSEGSIHRETASAVAGTPGALINAFKVLK